MTEHIEDELQIFLKKTGAPAVGAGVIDVNSAQQIMVAGQRSRTDNTPVTTDNTWHIGSCTKSMTAVLFGLLIDRGLTSWDAPITSLFPDLEEINPGWKQRSVASVFFCRAGMPANLSIPAMFSAWKDQRPLEQQRTELAINTFRKQPGRDGRFRYSNVGYILIGAAIDRLTGVPFETALDEYLFKPLGITSVGYGPPPHILGHSGKLRLPGGILLLKGKPKAADNPRSDNPPLASSAGTLYLTLSDWARFLSVFLKSNDETVVPNRVIDQLLDGPANYQMLKGIARAQMPGIDFGMQGSNTMWAAAVLIMNDREKISFTVCNDGRSLMLLATAMLAEKIAK